MERPSFREGHPTRRTQVASRGRVTHQNSFR
ncbi:hypothetical protein LINPERHAP2_LOCUS11942 [Linum perenne]